MQNETLPAPSGANQYAFITDPQKPAKKSFLPSGSSKQNRILLVVGGFVVLLFIITLVFVLIANIGTSQKKAWLSLAQQQQELIRVSDLGSTKAQNQDTKNLAITTKLALESSQASIDKLAAKNGAVITKKSLALGKNTQTDVTLTAAQQSNQFDQTFRQIIKTQLTDYQAQLKNLYDKTSSKSTKNSLSAANTSAFLLVGEASR